VRYSLTTILVSATALTACEASGPASSRPKSAERGSLALTATAIAGRWGPVERYRTHWRLTLEPSGDTLLARLTLSGRDLRGGGSVRDGRLLLILFDRLSLSFGGLRLKGPARPDSLELELSSGAADANPRRLVFVRRAE
jgi:hypothetical protein